MQQLGSTLTAEERQQKLQLVCQILGCPGPTGLDSDQPAAGCGADSTRRLDSTASPEERLHQLQLMCQFLGCAQPENVDFSGPVADMDERERQRLEDTAGPVIAALLQLADPGDPRGLGEAVLEHMRGEAGQPQPQPQPSSSGFLASPLGQNIISCYRTAVECEQPSEEVRMLSLVVGLEPDADIMRAFGCSMRQIQEAQHHVATVGPGLAVS